MDDQASILCVDDERNVLRSLERLCMDEPYALLTADSSAAALDLLARRFCPVVIADYRMPDMNGVAFLREVRRRFPDTVRIVLSGYADAATIVSAINEGEIYKFIPKPWNDDELKVTIRNALEKYLLEQENKRLTQELRAKNRELEELAHRQEDIIAQKTADLRIQNQSLQLAQTILNLLPLAVIGVDEEGTVVQLNAHAQRLFGAQGLVVGEPLENGMPDTVCHAVQEDGQPAPYVAPNGERGIVLSVPLFYGETRAGRVIILQKTFADPHAAGSRP